MMDSILILLAIFFLLFAFFFFPGSFVQLSPSSGGVPDSQVPAAATATGFSSSACPPSQASSQRPSRRSSRAGSPAPASPAGSPPPPRTGPASFAATQAKNPRDDLKAEPLRARDPAKRVPVRTIRPVRPGFSHPTPAQGFKGRQADRLSTEQSWKAAARKEMRARFKCGWVFPDPVEAVGAQSQPTAATSPSSTATKTRAALADSCGTQTATAVVSSSAVSTQTEEVLVPSCGFEAFPPATESMSAQIEGSLAVQAPQGPETRSPETQTEGQQATPPSPGEHDLPVLTQLPSPPPTSPSLSPSPSPPPVPTPSGSTIEEPLPRQEDLGTLSPEQQEPEDVQGPAPQPQEVPAARVEDFKIACLPLRGIRSNPWRHLVAFTQRGEKRKAVSQGSETNSNGARDETTGSTSTQGPLDRRALARPRDPRSRLLRVVPFEEGWMPPTTPPSMFGASPMRSVQFQIPRPCLVKRRRIDTDEDDLDDGFSLGPPVIPMAPGAPYGTVAGAGFSIGTGIGSLLVGGARLGLGTAPSLPPAPTGNVRRVRRSGAPNPNIVWIKPPRV